MCQVTGGEHEFYLKEFVFNSK